MEDFKLFSKNICPPYSFLKKPLSFQNGFFNGSFFYMPKNGQPHGGDDQAIISNGKKGIILLADAKGHGNEGYKNLQEYKPHLDSLLDLTLTNDGIKDIIIEMDKKANEISLALTYILLEPDRISYCNLGENHLTILKNKNSNLEKIPFNFMIGYGFLQNHLKKPGTSLLETTTFDKHGKIFVTTDGAYNICTEKNFFGPDKMGFGKNVILNQRDMEIGVRIFTYSISNILGETNIEDDISIVQLTLK